MGTGSENRLGRSLTNSSSIVLRERKLIAVVASMGRVWAER